jgi:hypothetical protein
VWALLDLADAIRESGGGPRRPPVSDLERRP